MTKFLSVFVSFAVLFQCTPISWAQVMPPFSRLQADRHSTSVFTRDGEPAPQQYQLLKQELERVLEEEDKYASLRREVQQAATVLLAPAPQSAPAEEQNLNEEEQAAFEAGRMYLRELSEKIYALGRQDIHAVRDLVLEGLPVFAQVDGVNQEVKDWAAGVLRGELTRLCGACEAAGLFAQISGKAKRRYADCEDVLKMTGALAALGRKGNSPDARAVAEVLSKGYDGPYGPSVIMIAGAALYAMDAGDLLVAQLYRAGLREPDVGLLGKDFSFLALQDYVKMAKNVWERGDWSIGEEYAYYPTQDRALGNAWTDLGMFLGEEASLSGRHAAAAQDILRRVISGALVVRKDGSLGLRFPSFISGALAGGYRLQPMPSAQYVLAGNGGGYYEDMREGWDKLTRHLRQWGVSLTGLAVLQMYFRGKSDLDPYTKTAVNNMLADIYARSGSTAVVEGVEKKDAPSYQEIKQGQNWDAVSRFAGGVDMALAAAGTIALGAGAVKGIAGGAQLMRRLTRTFKLARTAGRVSGTGFAQGYSRVIRLGRMHKPAFAGLSALAETKLSPPPSAGKQKVKVYNLAAASLEGRTVSVPKNKDKVIARLGSRLTEKMQKELLEEGGPELLRQVQKSLRVPEEKSAVLPSKKGRYSVKKKTGAKPKKASAKVSKTDILPREHAEFFGQENALLLRYLRQTYGLTPDAVKDLGAVFAHADALPDGLAFKQAVFRRTEELLGRKDVLLERYAAYVKRPAKPSVRVYYLGEKDWTKPLNFKPKQIMLALEEPLQGNTLADLPSMANRVNSAKTPWHMNEKGVSSISWKSNKKPSADDLARLYTNLLDCSAYSPCFYEFNAEGTLMLYRADKKIWLRVGEHEVVNKFHLHVHTDKLFHVPGGIQNGMERVILNYRIPLTDIQHVLQPAARVMEMRTYSAFVPSVRETQSYRLFVSEALERLKNANAVLPLE